MNYTFSQLSVKKIVLAVLLAAFFLACVEKDKPEPVPEPVPQVLTAMFDKTEYFPFDFVEIQLSERAAREEYSGTLGDNPVTAVRMTDSTLVMMTPDLPAGEYLLTIPVSDKPNERNIQSRLRIKPLPTVENPDAVIEEITATFADMLAVAEQENNPNVEVLKALEVAFDELISQLSDAERQQFASLWQAQFDEMFNFVQLRATVEERKREVNELIYDIRSNIADVNKCIKWFAIWTSVAVYPDPFTRTMGLTFAGCTLIKGIYHFVQLFTLESRLKSYAFIVGNKIVLKSAGEYDYIISNGESLIFSPEIDIRSITAEDRGSSSTAIDVISVLDSFLDVWNEIQASISKLPDFLKTAVPGLGGRPQSVSAIQSPFTTETVTLDDWSLEIVSGNVTAQKVDANSYVFTTTATESVEFEFKIIAEDIESQVFTALLEVDMPPEITTTTLPEGKVGEPYNFILAATGSQPISWVTIDGITPVGITFYTETGVISGIPEEAGTFKFFMRARNEFGEDVKELTMIINEKDEEDNPFVDTWNKDASAPAVTFVFGQSSWISYVGGSPYNSGTYSFTGNTAVLTVTNNGNGSASTGSTGSATIMNGKMSISGFSDATMNGQYSKSTVSDLETSAFDGRITAVVQNGNAYNSVISRVKALYYTDSGEEHVVASGTYANGGFTMTLPSTPNAGYLSTIGSLFGGAGNMIISDRNANIMSIDLFEGFNADDYVVCDFSYESAMAGNTTTYTTFMYADRDVSFTGSFNDREGAEIWYYNCSVSLKRGWNIMYRTMTWNGNNVDVNLTTKAVSGVRWTIADEIEVIDY